MTTNRQQPLNIPANRDRLIARASESIEESVSVGGLAARLGFLPESAGAPVVHRGESPRAPAREMLARLVELSRRERALTLEQFAAQSGVDLEDIVLIEAGHGEPDARALHKLSAFLGLSYEKLLVLGGLRQVRDVNLEQSAVRFAASSGPMDKLTATQAQALHEFVRILHD